MKVDVDLIEKAVWDADIDLEEGLYRKYSGRGMYGRTCFGIVGGMSDFAKFICQLTQIDPDLAWDLSQNVSRDSMAFDTIFYFPSYQLDEETEDGDE